MKEAKLAEHNSFSLFKTCEGVKAQKESGIQSRTLRAETSNSNTEQNEIVHCFYKQGTRGQKSLVQRYTMRARNQFERFRVFLELISRFEFEFCRCEIFFEGFEFFGVFM